jgi:hypothetical protein
MIRIIFNFFGIIIYLNQFLIILIPDIYKNKCLVNSYIQLIMNTELRISLNLFLIKRLNYFNIDPFDIWISNILFIGGFSFYVIFFYHIFFTFENLFVLIIIFL